MNRQSLKPTNTVTAEAPTTKSSFGTANEALAEAIQRWNRGEDPREALDLAFEAAGQAPGWPGPKLQEGIRNIAEAYGFVIGESKPTPAPGANERPTGLRHQTPLVPPGWTTRDAADGHLEFLRQEGPMRFTVRTAAYRAPLTGQEFAYLELDAAGKGAPTCPCNAYGDEALGQPLYYGNHISDCFKEAARLIAQSAPGEDLAYQLLAAGWLPEGTAVDFRLTAPERSLLLELHARFNRNQFRLSELPPNRPNREMEQDLRVLVGKGLLAPGGVETGSKATWTLTPLGEDCARKEWQFHPGDAWQCGHTGGGCTAFYLTLPSRTKGEPWTLMLTSEEGMEAPDAPGEPSWLGVYDQTGSAPWEPQPIFTGTAEDAAEEGLAVLRLIESASQGTDDLDDAAILALLRQELPKRGWGDALASK